MGAIWDEKTFSANFVGNVESLIVLLRENNSTASFNAQIIWGIEKGAIYYTYGEPKILKRIWHFLLLHY